MAGREGTRRLVPMAARAALLELVAHPGPQVQRVRQPDLQAVARAPTTAAAVGVAARVWEQGPQVAPAGP